MQGWKHGGGLALLRPWSLRGVLAAGSWVRLLCRSHQALHAPLSLSLQALEGMQGESIALQPGEATLHHIRLAHCSGPAQPGAPPRLGLALRYMAAHVQQQREPRDSVTVVSGRDTFGQYRHELRPAGELDAAALQQHAAAVAAVHPVSQCSRSLRHNVV